MPPLVYRLVVFIDSRERPRAGFREPSHDTRLPQLRLVGCGPAATCSTDGIRKAIASRSDFRGSVGVTSKTGQPTLFASVSVDPRSWRTRIGREMSSTCGRYSLIRSMKSSAVSPVSKNGTPGAWSESPAFSTVGVIDVRDERNRGSFAIAARSVP